MAKLTIQKIKSNLSSTECKYFFRKNMRDNSQTLNCFKVFYLSDGTIGIVAKGKNIIWGVEGYSTRIYDVAQNKLSPCTQVQDNELITNLSN